MASDPTIIQAVINDIQQLDDSFPIVLFPVRVETRFMTIKHVVQKPAATNVRDAATVGGLSPTYQKNLEFLNDRIQNEEANAVLIPGLKIPEGDPLADSLTNPLGCHPDQKELWIRLFPDDIAIQTHEKELTEDELNSAKLFWQGLHQAEHPPQEVLDNRSPEEIDNYKQNQRIGAWKALLNSYGTARTVWIINEILPNNPDEFPQEAPVFDADPDTKPVSWNEQPCTRIMPDRFVALLYNDAGDIVEYALGNTIPDPLYVGINPQETQADAFAETGSGLLMPENIKWLTDFKAAEEVGMGLSIPLDPSIDNHQFAKLLIIGVRGTFSAEEGQATINDLLQNHQFAEGGLSLIPFGTPSNNTQAESSGRSLDELSPEESFALFVAEKMPEENTDPLTTTDGQRMDQALGISPPLFEGVWGGKQQEISSAVWMNMALSPGTIGYALPQYFCPDLSPDEVRSTLRYMEPYVLGRGALPALRVDEQPYGIIPVTAFSKWASQTAEGLGPFLGNLNTNVLQHLASEWRKLVQSHVKHLTKDLNGDQVSSTFLEILEQHATSVDFFQRLVLDEQALTTLQAVTENTGSDFVSNIGVSRDMLITNLESIGFNLNNALLGLGIFQSSRLGDLTGPIIESLPFLEDTGLSALPGSELNFLQWMAASDTTFEQLLNEAPFDGTDTFPPRSLLYLLNRFSLLRQYLQAGLRLGIAQAPFADAVALDYPRNMVWVQEGLAPEREPHFQLILEQAAARVAAETPGETPEALATSFVEGHGYLFSGNNRWAVMDQPIEEGSTTTIREFINANMGDSGDALLAELRQHKELLGKLGALSTAQLERLFAEHLDLCHFRLDAWLLGLANFRLEELREAKTTGTFFGAFAYLENLVESPQNGIFVKELTADEAAAGEGVIAPLFDVSGSGLSGSDLAAFLDASFVYLGGQPAGELDGATYLPVIAFDQAAGKVLPVPRAQLNSLGFIPAPSLPHASTAAILRNAYASHRKTGSPEEAFAIDLSSARTREAMYFLEGMRNGQSVAELLGYKFERALREDPDYAIQLLFEIREQYPFEMQPIGQEVDELVKSEARNVVNGLSLIEGYRSFADETDFFNQFGVVTEPQKTAIRTAIQQLENTLDAIKDLLLAESMYQLAVENTDRSRAALRTLNDMGNVQMPEVVNIPREGISLTHRVGVQLSRLGGLQEWLGGRSARSSVEPRINRWLREKLPDSGRIAIRVRWVDHHDEEENPVYSFDKVLLKHLALQPIDFVYLLYQDRENPLDGELRYRVDHLVRSQKDLREEQYVELIPGDREGFEENEVTIFSLEPLVMGLADLIINARPMGPEDLLLQNDPENEGIDTEWSASSFRRRVGVLEPILVRLTEKLESQLPRLEQLANLNEADLKAEDPDELQGFFKELRETLLSFTSLGWVEALPMRDRRITLVNVSTFHRQSLKLHEKAEKQLDKIQVLFAQEEALADEAKLEKIELLKEIVELGLNKTFNVFPEFKIRHSDDYQQALDFEDLLAFAGEFALEEWMQSLVPVRPRMALYHKTLMLSELFDAPAAGEEVRPIQFPFVGDGQDRWLGVPYPAYYDDFDENNQRRLPDDTLSLVFEYPDDFTADRICAGFIFDEWTEQIPVKDTNIGVAMHYDKPNSEPPNAILLAVSPEVNGNWSWEDLLLAIHESFELARFRAVDPDVIRKSALSQFLPAIIPPINLKNHMPAIDLGRNMAEAAPGDSSIIFKNYDLDKVEVSPNFDVGELALDDIFDND